MTSLALSTAGRAALWDELQKIASAQQAPQPRSRGETASRLIRNVLLPGAAGAAGTVLGEYLGRVAADKLLIPMTSNKRTAMLVAAPILMGAGAALSAYMLSKREERRKTVFQTESPHVR